MDPPSTGPMFLGITFTLLALSLIFVGLRFHCRLRLVGKIGVDDWIMLAALINAWGMGVINIFQIKFGTGKSQIYLDMDNVVPTLKVWYVYQLEYLITLCLVKISILAFYWRLSPNWSYRMTIYAVGGIVGAYTTAMVFVNAFECAKPSDAWSPQFPERCNNLVAVYYGQASFNILSDIAILLLPVPIVLKLQVNNAKKFALLAIFSVGSIAVIASIARLHALYIYQHSKDIPYDAIYILLWSQIEINVAIISISTPSLKPLFRTLIGDRTFQQPNKYGTDCGQSRSRFRQVLGSGGIASNKLNVSHHKSSKLNRSIHGDSGSLEEGMGGFKLHGYCKGESTANVRAGIVGLHTSNRTRKGDSEEDIINAGFYQTFPGAITRTMEVEVSCHNASVYDLEDLSDHRQLYPTRSRKSDESLAGLKKHTQFG